MSKNDFTAFTNDILDFINSATKKQIKLSVGEIEGLLIDTLKSVAPFSKVAFIATSNSYVKWAQKVFTLIRKANGVPLGMTIEDKGIYLIERVSDLFALPEDVRAVVSVDCRISGIISYFAGLRGIPHVSMVLSRDIEGLLNCSSFIKSGDKLNRVICDVNRIIIIDNNVIDSSSCIEDRASLVLKNLTALYDYRLKTVLDGAVTNKGGYALIKSGITDYVASCMRNDHQNCLVAQIKMQIGNLLSDGEIYDNSAFEQYSLLYKVIGCGGTNKDSNVGEHIYSLYKNVQSVIINGRQTSDLSDIEQASNLLGIDRSVLLRARITHYKWYETRYSKILSLARNIENEIKLNKEIFSALKIDKMVEANKELIDSAVKYFPYGYNVLKI